MREFTPGQEVQVRDEVMKPWLTQKYLTYANGKHWVVNHYGVSAIAYSYLYVRHAKDEYGNAPLNVTETKHPNI